MSKHGLTARFAQTLDETGLAPQFQREYKFHDERRWRFDFADIEHKIAVEVEGGTWAGGRHNFPSGMSKDCEKYNEATVLGWRVLRYATVSEMMKFREQYLVLVNLIYEERKGAEIPS